MSKVDPFYKIKEISKLYGLCTDTLRYYEEQGILSPKRGTNNYRLFSIQDIGKLNIIRSLRALNIPIERIRDYISTRNIDATLLLLDEEEDLILQRIQELKEQYEDISLRRRELLADKKVKDKAFSIHRYEARPCFEFTGDVIIENNIDFVLKKLEHKYEDNIHVIGIKGFGAQMAGSWQQGNFNRFQSVFFVSGWDNHNSEIPEGEYASLYFWGEYERISEVFSVLQLRTQKEGYEICGDPMEFYHIDMNDTNNPMEYLTEVQIKVRKTSSAT